MHNYFFTSPQTFKPHPRSSPVLTSSHDAGQSQWTTLVGGDGESDGLACMQRHANQGRRLHHLYLCEGDNKQGTG